MRIRACRNRPGLQQGLLTYDPAGETARDGVRRMQALYVDSFKSINVRPDFGQILIWDAALLVVDVLRHVGPTATPQQAREYLSSVHDWAGANGRYDFRGGKQRGVGVNAIAMDRWDAEHDAFVAVSTAGGQPLK